ncbi:MAG: ATP-binding cassette domain-containing protein [Candidatus Izemoplasmatales bacterium]|nr:ATP-binding cassette domain-containing protein [Candidatus Izemoplasmatales bacterium]
MLVEKIKINYKSNSSYPFNLELFKKDIELDVNSPVTIILGENGSGKSSLLKLIQEKLNLVKIHIPGNFDDHEEVDSRSVAIFPNFGKIKGFFFESLTFVNYIEYIKKEIIDSKEHIKRIDVEYKKRSNYAKIMAKTPYNRTISELENMYSVDLAKSSHGEAYLDFFASRIKDNQLYLLDEPETPLSVQNQLTLTAMIIEATKRNCQFIIATHSPILPAIPESIVYEIKDNNFIKSNYDSIESIKMLKQFLNNKEQFLRYLKD